MQQQKKIKIISFRFLYVFQDKYDTSGKKKKKKSNKKGNSGP